VVGITPATTATSTPTPWITDTGLGISRNLQDTISSINLKNKFKSVTPVFKSIPIPTIEERLSHLPDVVLFKGLKISFQKFNM
jgi:hypothetical protein